MKGSKLNYILNLWNRYPLKCIQMKTLTSRSRMVFMMSLGALPVFPSVSLGEQCMIVARRIVSSKSSPSLSHGWKRPFALWSLDVDWYQMTGMLSCRSFHMTSCRTLAIQKSASSSGSGRTARKECFEKNHRRGLYPCRHIKHG